MAHSYTSCLFHCVFSTQERRPLIVADWRERLWAYMGGIARENGARALAVGGTENHAHVLLGLPATLTVAKAVQLVKGGSSKWVHETFSGERAFRWQEGYGAFSIGVSRAPDTIAYIHGQETHHRTRSFEEEFVAILRRHGMEYDERYVWG